MVSTDEYFKELNLQWEAGKLNSGVYQKRGGVFYYKNIILVSPISPLTQILIVEHLDIPMGAPSEIKGGLLERSRAV